jgi:hypothetical protein
VHVALPFLVIPLLSHRRTTLVTAAAIGTFGVVPLLIQHHGWPGMWTGNLHLTMTGGHVNDTSSSDPEAWKFLTRTYLLSLFTGSRAIAKVIALGAAVVGFTISMARNRSLLLQPKYAALPLLPLAGLTLLAGHHPTYDAALLLTGIPTLRPLASIERRTAITVGAGLLQLVLPLPAVLSMHFPQWAVSRLRFTGR